MKILKKMKGITLISLIATIIILLILAGISIQLIGGSNGILKRASEALDANDKAAATEKMELKITYLNMVSYGENTRKATLQELADGLFADKEVEYVKLKNHEVATLQPIDVTGESSFFVKLKEYSYEFEIDENLQLASVDGVKVENNNTVTIGKEEYEDLLDRISNLETQVMPTEFNPDSVASAIKALDRRSAGVTCITDNYMTRDYNGDYFEYDAEKGFIVKKSGWYFIYMNGHISSSGSTFLSLSINDKNFALDKRYNPSAHIGHSVGNSTLFLKQEDCINGYFEINNAGANHSFEFYIYSFE